MIRVHYGIKIKKLQKVELIGLIFERLTCHSSLLIFCRYTCIKDKVLIAG